MPRCSKRKFLRLGTRSSAVAARKGCVPFVHRHHDQETEMGKYFVAWLLGVPAFVLVLIYFIF